MAYFNKIGIPMPLTVLCGANKPCVNDFLSYFVKDGLNIKFVCTAIDGIKFKI